MATAIGLFDRYEDAERAVDTLLSRGFVKDEIGVMARDDVVQDYRKDSTATAAEVGGDTGTGAVGGALLGGFGGLLAGMAALLIPGIGPAITAGTLASALGLPLVGAGIGAAAGGVIGALINMGVPEEHAHVYAEGVKRGGVLVTVRTSDARVDDAQEILRSANNVDVDLRRAQWRQDGWSAFDETAATRPKTDPEKLESQHAPERRQADPLTEVQADKHGT
jgi:uncharacterized membrane protein